MSNINQLEPPVLGSAEAPISRVDPKTSMTGWSTENAGQQGEQRTLQVGLKSLQLNNCAASTMPGDGQAEPSDAAKLPFKEQVRQIG